MKRRKVKGSIGLVIMEDGAFAESTHLYSTPKLERVDVVRAIGLVNLQPHNASQEALTDPLLHGPLCGGIDAIKPVYLSKSAYF
jgi:hypothetical protein